MGGAVGESQDRLSTNMGQTVVASIAPHDLAYQAVQRKNRIHSQVATVMRIMMGMFPGFNIIACRVAHSKC